MTGFQSSIPWNRWYIARIFKKWLELVGFEELAGGLEPLRNSEIF